MEELTQMSASTEGSLRGLSINEAPSKDQPTREFTGLTTEIKKWLYTPAEQSEDREKICRQLEEVESKLFAIEGMLDLYQEEASSLERACKEVSNDAVAMQQLKQLQLKIESKKSDLEAFEKHRQELLNDYWTRFFKSEWPNAARSFNLQARASMTSPNMQMAAEKMIALREAISSGPRDGDWAGDQLESAAASPRAWITKKRALDLPTSFPLVKQQRSSSGESKDGGGEGAEGEDGDPALIRCNCKKSRCLKLYCECFAARKMCVDECKCVDCANNETHKKKREEAIKQVLERRPDAFHTKVFVATAATPVASATSSTTADSQVALAHARGCTCRKTKCTKKYCVCFNSQVKCGDWCRCTDCENGKGDYPLVNEASIASTQSSSSTDKLSVLASITTAVQAN